jgi:hypothetical protein
VILSCDGMELRFTFCGAASMSESPAAARFPPT